MRAFENTPATKAELIANIEAQYEAGRVVQGRAHEEGCSRAVRCSLIGFAGDASEHEPREYYAAYEQLFGISRVLARLKDALFEQLPEEMAVAWPLRFAQAVPEGADLSMVWPRFAIWMLSDEELGVLQFAPDEARSAIMEAVDLYRLQVEGAAVEMESFREVANQINQASDLPEVVGSASQACDAANAACYAALDQVDTAAVDASYALSHAAGAWHIEQRSPEEIAQAQADKLIELLEAA